MSGANFKLRSTCLMQRGHDKKHERANTAFLGVKSLWSGMERMQMEDDNSEEGG